MPRLSPSSIYVEYDAVFPSIPRFQVRRLDNDEPRWRRTTVTSDARGVYWRILVPGEYLVRAVVRRERLGPKPGQVEVVERAVSEEVRVEVRAGARRPAWVPLVLRERRRKEAGVRGPSGAVPINGEGEKEEEEEVEKDEEIVDDDDDVLFDF